MRVGVFTPLLSQLPLPVVLKKLAALHIDTVELATGNYVGDAHCKVSMLENPVALAEFQKILADHGTKISALSCHGNPLHPDKDRAKQDREVSRKTILLAEKLGVPMMVDFSGCPGDSPNATAPNWVTCPWPPDYLKVLDWQWNEVVAPYWIEHAKFAGRPRSQDRRRNAPRVCGLQPGDHAAAALDRRTQRGLQLRSQSSLLAEHRSNRRRARASGRHFSRPCQGHAALSQQPGAYRRARHQTVHARA